MIFLFFFLPFSIDNSKKEQDDPLYAPKDYIKLAKEYEKEVEKEKS